MPVSTCNAVISARSQSGQREGVFFGMARDGDGVDLRRMLGFARNKVCAQSRHWQRVWDTESSRGQEDFSSNFSEGL